MLYVPPVIPHFPSQSEPLADPRLSEKNLLQRWCCRPGLLGVTERRQGAGSHNGLVQRRRVCVCRLVLLTIEKELRQDGRGQTSKQGGYFIQKCY